MKAFAFCLLMVYVLGFTYFTLPLTLDNLTNIDPKSYGPTFDSWGIPHASEKDVTALRQENSFVARLMFVGLVGVFIPLVAMPAAAWVPATIVNVVFSKFD